MDRNLILAFALSMAVFSGWLAWQEQVRGPERRAAAERVQAAREAEATRDEFAEESEQPVREQVRIEREFASEEQGERRARPWDSPAAEEETSPVDLWSGTLETEHVSAELSNRGGIVTGWRIRDYFETPRQEVDVELIDLPRGAPAMLATPFESLGYGDLGEALYTVESATPSEVVFVLERGDVEVRKTYRTVDARYALEVEVEVVNRSSASIEPEITFLVPAAVNPRPDFKEVSLLALANNEVERELVPSVGGGSFFGGLFGGDEGPYAASSGVLWAGMDLRYFASVVVSPEPDETAVEFVPLEEGKLAAVRLTTRAPRLAPGEGTRHAYLVFMGPKEAALLKELGHELNRTISQGWSWVAPLTAFFGWALQMVQRVVPNYGLAIIVLTVLVRVATWPIMARQMKSAERMRELMPRIKELQEKYKDDRQKQSEATFKLYRETGVNPLGGCLPMVLQLPVFIGLFYALQSSIDLRHAAFMLWINDLSAPATLFTLPGMDFPVRIMPILMSASMFAQQKMMPQTGMDPAQARMMLIMMPGMMLVISYTFPSGLVLYWLVSNLLGIGHQLWVRRKMQAVSA